MKVDFAGNLQEAIQQSAIAVAIVGHAESEIGATVIDRDAAEAGSRQLADTRGQKRGAASLAYLLEQPFQAGDVPLDVERYATHAGNTINMVVRCGGEIVADIDQSLPYNIPQ